MKSSRFKVNIQIESLRQTLGYSHSVWAEHLGLSQKGYELFRTRNKDISIATCMELAEKFQFSLESLRDGNIDFKALAARQSGDCSYIPEKYRKAAFSRFQTARVIFDFLENKRGFPTLAGIYRHFQLHPRVFADTDGAINILMFMDLFRLLEERWAIPKDFFYEMGQHSTDLNYSSPLGIVCRKQKSVEDIFELVFGEYLPYFEKNANYKILKLDAKQCVVQTRTKKKMCDAFSVKHIGSPAICEWKKGLFASIPKYLRLDSGHAEELRCVHRGDPYCIFRITFTEGSRQRSFEN